MRIKCTFWLCDEHFQQIQLLSAIRCHQISKEDQIEYGLICDVEGCERPAFYDVYGVFEVRELNTTDLLRLGV